MSKLEFLERLEKLLWDIPYTERREALNYYTEYFEDAEKDEEEVIRTLGSPEEVAHNIRQELAGKELVEPIETHETFDHEKDEVVYVVAENNQSDSETNGNRPKEEKKGLETWQIVLIVVAAILLFPIWGSAVTGLAGGIIGLIAGFLALILSLGVIAVACFSAALIILGVSFAVLFSNPVGAFFGFGATLFLVGIALLSLIAFIKCITVVIPAICKGIVSLWHKAFDKKEGVAA
ncbi:MAG: hypothetical protein J1E61_01155 [Lachnospiraceae bacterium]|nr:hypothetical protein [Lachnospiraceae bacterium]